MCWHLRCETAGTQLHQAWHRAVLSSKAESTARVIFLSVSTMSLFERSEKGWDKDVGFAPTLSVSNVSIPFSGELLFQSHSLATLPWAGYRALTEADNLLLCS